VQTGRLPGCRVPGEADPSSMRPIACLHRNRGDFRVGVSGPPKSVG
jgi:hypothetical protein